MLEHAIDSCACSGKQCHRCKEIRCIGQFHRKSNSSDGYRNECKICRKAERETDEFKAARRAKHKENADRINEKKRARYRQNSLVERARRKAYRDTHPEQEKAFQYRYNRSEQGKTRFRRWIQRNPEKRHAIEQNYRMHHTKEVVESHQVSSANYKTRRVGVEGILTVEEWRTVKAKFDYACVRCGRKEPEILLTIDHVNPFYLKGTNHIENIQPLCAQCNSSKGVKPNDYRETGSNEQSA